MFHVKHRREAADGAEGEIGADVRRRVEDALRPIGWSPASPDFLVRIETFANLLSSWGARHNLTAQPRNPAELAFHIVDSLMAIPILERLEDFASMFGQGQRVLDLGSGAGLPALVLAAATEAEFTLLESRRKRVSFLRIAIAEMGLRNAQVDPSFLRSEELTPSFDVVTARAFAKPAAFLTMALAGLRSDGRAILYANGEVLGSKHQLAVPERTLLYEVRRGEQMVARRLLVWRKG